MTSEEHLCECGGTLVLDDEKEAFRCDRCNKRAHPYLALPNKGFSHPPRFGTKDAAEREIAEHPERPMHIREDWPMPKA